jgi:hypothetical protein
MHASAWLLLERHVCEAPTRQAAILPVLLQLCRTAVPDLYAFRGSSAATSLYALHPRPL